MKKKKPLWLRLILWIGSSILSLCSLLAIFCAFLYFKYDINPFTLVSDLNSLSAPVNENELYKNKYSDDDLIAMDNSSNTLFNNLIEVNDGNINVNTSNFNSITSLTQPVKFSDKQVAAIINKSLEPEDKVINVQDYTFNFEIIQIQFSNLKDENIDFNVVIKLDITSLKSNIDKFPTKLIKNKIPDYLYISSTVTINKLTDNFKYEVKGKSVSINNLSEEKTEEILHILSLLSPSFSKDNLSLMLGKPFVDGMIGYENNGNAMGLGYSLKKALIFINDYTFTKDNEVIYFTLSII